MEVLWETLEEVSRAPDTEFKIYHGDSSQVFSHANFEIYRGDSFQIVTHTKWALTAALMIRAKLISQSLIKNKGWDARISIGIGSVNNFGKKISESHGEAFLLSGRGLDEMHKKNNRLNISFPSLRANRSLEISTMFADDIVSGWSGYSAETAYYFWHHNESQIQLAKRLGKSQPTINKRMFTAKLGLLKKYIKYVDEVIDWERER